MKENSGVFAKLKVVVKAFMNGSKLLIKDVREMREISRRLKGFLPLTSDKLKGLSEGSLQAPVSSKEFMFVMNVSVLCARYVLWLNLVLCVPSVMLCVLCVPSVILCVLCVPSVMLCVLCVPSVMLCVLCVPSVMLCVLCVPSVMLCVLCVPSVMLCVLCYVCSGY